ncbi:DUF1819 family protein [Lacticigenium naphthae]|uniref:DUF1819 family protein n=1 Tax=Lacticigenium naphthae TaxID=515351 RepID=UPI0004094643|nr:DUF1819 family protein [Lacticigenium naphthae]
MKKKYLTTLNTRPFLYQETRMITELMDQGLTDEDIKEKVLEENIFQLSSDDRKQSFLGEIKRRLNYLDEFLLRNFITSDSQTSKIILLYAILKKDRLFYEWMREVVLDKWLTLDYEISKKDTEYFFEKKIEQNDTVAKWKKETRARLVNSYHQTLADANYASIVNHKIILHRPVISSNVENYLANNKDKYIVEVLLGEVIQ